MGDQAKPEEVTEGYNYPVPENPLVLPTKPPTTTEKELPAYSEDPVLDYTEAPDVQEYDDYDPNDIPEDQAKPEEVTKGHNYPVPENPLVLPTNPSLPDCVPVGEEELGDNPYFLDQGVPTCPEDLASYTEAPPVQEYDDYDPDDIPADQAAPEQATEGYNYPVPENLLALPTKPSTTIAPLPDCVTLDDPMLETYQELDVPLCPVEEPIDEYDDYDPSDIPEDQAKPEEVTEGYNYPVPENPLVLPTKPPLPECVPAGEEQLGDNPYFLEQGVPLCPEDLPVYTEAPVEEYDDYDPSDIPEDQAKPEEVTEGYNYPVPENPLLLPTKPPKAPLPDCVLEDDEGAAELIAQGVPLCPEVLPVYTEAAEEEDYDDYDPNDIPEDQAAPEELPTYTEAPVVEYDDYDPNDIPEDQAAPEEVTEGYNYPVPENPLVLPSPADDLPGYSPETEVVEYDDYDPNDIPDDQAAPTGYNYPVPENPLQLPSRARKAKLVVDEDEGVTIGLTHLDTDTYDPGNYDHNSPDYLEEVDAEEERSGIEVIRQGGRSGNPETGVSLTGPGHVISFHVPEEHLKMVERQQLVMREDFGTKKQVDPFSSILGGELLPPVLRKIQKNKVEQKSSKLTKIQEESSNEVESTLRSFSKNQRGEGRRSGRFNNGRNRKNKRTKNKNKANKHNKVAKSKNTTSATTIATTVTESRST